MAVYSPRTVSETFERIVAKPSQPWVAAGDFLDDWRRLAVSSRADLVRKGPAIDAHDDLEIRRWASFLAAAVEYLCRQDGLEFPAWTSDRRTYLLEPWFLYPGDLMKPWQIAATPTPFRMRNIFGGDRILDRV